jgi:hypothetical protein
MTATTFRTTSEKIDSLPKKSVSILAYNNKLPYVESFRTGDKSLQSTKIRRYMRRGSRCPSMLMIALQIPPDNQETRKTEDKGALSLLTEALNMSLSLQECWELRTTRKILLNSVDHNFHHWLQVKTTMTALKRLRERFPKRLFLCTYCNIKLIC